MLVYQCKLVHQCNIRKMPSMVLALSLISISLYHLHTLVSHIFITINRINFKKPDTFYFHYTQVKKAPVGIAGIFIIRNNLLLLILQIYGQENIVSLGSCFPNLYTLLRNRSGNVLQWQWSYERDSSYHPCCPTNIYWDKTSTLKICLKSL